MPKKSQTLRWLKFGSNIQFKCIFKWNKLVKLWTESDTFSLVSTSIIAPLVRSCHSCSLESPHPRHLTQSSATTTAAAAGCRLSSARAWRRCWRSMCRSPSWPRSRGSSTANLPRELYQYLEFLNLDNLTLIYF